MQDSSEKPLSFASTTEATTSSLQITTSRTTGTADLLDVPVISSGSTSTLPKKAVKTQEVDAKKDSFTVVLSTSTTTRLLPLGLTQIDTPNDHNCLFWS